MAIIKLHQNRINPLVLPVILAKELGYFDRYQVDVDLRLADDFIFNGKEEFLNGQVDAMMGDTTFFFYYLKEGKKAKITSNLTRTIQLVGQVGSLEKEALKIGVSRTGLFRFFQEYFLTEPLKSAKPVWLNNTYERINAFNKGEVDGLVAIDPFVSEVIEEPSVEVLWHSNELPYHFVMWCFDSQFIQDHPEKVRGFHQALGDAMKYFNQQTPIKKSQLSFKYCSPSKNLGKTMSHFFFETPENYQVEAFNLCQDWMYQEGELTERYQPEDCLFEGIR